MVKTFAILILLFAGFSGPAAAQCRQALALGLDISSSVDEGEYAAQIDGLAQALNDPKVREALVGTTSGHAALMVYEWSGKNQQSVIQPWIEITDNARIDTVINNLRGHQRSALGQLTALGYALGFGATQLANSPDCIKHTLDISGDGIANAGYRPSSAYLNYDFGDTVVNALIIGTVDVETLSLYFEQEVIYGFGSFIEVAHGFDDYARAMKLKLLRELTTLAVSELEE